MKALRATLKSVSNISVLMVFVLLVCIHLNLSIVWETLGIGGSIISIVGKLILKKRKRPFYEHCRDLIEKIVTIMVLSLIGYMSLLWLYTQTHEGVNADPFSPPLLSLAFYTMICGVVYVNLLVGEGLDDQKSDEN